MEKFHKTGYVYNDLKGDNICIGEYKQEATKLKLIDFGLCSKYLDDNGEHIKPESAVFKGNFCFSSANSLSLKSTSRRDDLISIFYLLVYLSNENKFMFQLNDKLNLVDNYEKITFLKMNVDVETICRRSNCKYLIDFGKAVFDISFEEKPNYSKLIFLLKINLLNMDIIPSDDILFYGS